MKKQLHAAERRRHSRRDFKDIAYAIVNTENILVGHLLDISKGGIAFSYVGSHSIDEPDITVDLFIYYRDLYLEKIPISLASSLTLHSASPLSRVPMMRCGAFFEGLDKKQEDSLLSIISSLPGEETPALS